MNFRAECFGILEASGLLLASEGVETEAVLCAEVGALVEQGAWHQDSSVRRLQPSGAGAD
jgi:hypothetical protein